MVIRMGVAMGFLKNLNMILFSLINVDLLIEKGLEFKRRFNPQQAAGDLSSPGQ